MTGVVTRADKGAPLSATDHDDNLEVMISLHKSATEPSPTYACMLWADTSTTLLKMRNSADSAWITLGDLDTAGAFSSSSLTDQDQLSELSDVTITSVADNEVLAYDSTASKWINQTAAEAGLATSAQGTLADSALQSADIGSTVQAYDSNLTSFVGVFTLPTTDGTADQVLTTNGSGTLSFADAAGADPSYGLFRKVDPTAVLFTKTGAGTAETQTALYVEVNGSVLTIASGTSVDMPSLTAGTDYAIWAETDGSLQASTNHTTPPSANARKIGGFHYAPGGNATGTSGGNTTAQINEYSFWDLKFRPACPDPRGMTLVADGFWMDIYLTGVDAITNGSSKYNVTIADGSSPPKVPTTFGGNGSTTYGSYTWFEAMELATAFGKRCPTQQEFMSAAYGTTEASSRGSDPGTTQMSATDDNFTSKWGVIQSTGTLWVWGQERGGAYNTGGWNANTEGRGSEYNAPNAVILGGGWNATSDSGSRCSAWNNAASLSINTFGSRFACDHLILD